jgi:hypothetical protein
MLSYERDSRNVSGYDDSATSIRSVTSRVLSPSCPGSVPGIHVWSAARR